MIGKFQTLPIDHHERVSSILCAALERPLKYENGSISLPFNIMVHFGFRMPPIIQNENEFRHYEKFLVLLHQVLKDEFDVNLHALWILFWVNLGGKYPDVVVEHIDQIFYEAFIRKEKFILSIFPVSFDAKKRRITTSRFDYGFSQKSN